MSETYEVLMDEVQDSLDYVDLTDLTDKELIDLNRFLLNWGRKVREEYWDRRGFDKKDIR